MNRIREIRKAQGLKQDALARAAGVTQPTVSDWENGKIALTNESAIRLAEYLGVSLDYLLGRTATPETSPLSAQCAIPITTHRIPLLGTIHCGEPTFAEESFEAYVEVGAKIKADFALRARGDSMIGARIHDGDIVFIHQQDTVADGEIAAILLDDEAALKRVRYIPGGMVSLHAENPKYPPIYIGGENETRTVRILGKAVAFQSDVR